MEAILPMLSTEAAVRVYAEMNQHDLVSFSLRRGYFSTAAALFTRFQGQGEMNEEDLVELIVSLLSAKEIV